MTSLDARQRSHAMNATPLALGAGSSATAIARADAGSVRSLPTRAPRLLLARSATTSAGHVAGARAPRSCASSVHSLKPSLWSGGAAASGEVRDGRPPSRLLASRARRVNGQMPNPPRHLQLVAGIAATPARCRAKGCPLVGQGELGYCAWCEAVYHAGRELRERLLEAQGARIAAAHPELFAALAPERRATLLTHLAARAQHAGRPGSIALDEEAFADFLAECKERGDAA
jgi:hypothetical protein